MGGEIRVERFVRDSFGRRVAVLEAYLCRCKCQAFRSIGWNDFLAATNGVHYCLACRSLFRISQVRGRVAPEHKCDARCTGAKGANCECACGGKNHGAQS